MQRKTMFYERFFNWIKGSVIIDFSSEHNLTSIYRKFFLSFLSIWKAAVLNATNERRNQQTNKQTNNNRQINKQTHFFKREIVSYKLNNYIESEQTSLKKRSAVCVNDVYVISVILVQSDVNGVLFEIWFGWIETWTTIDSTISSYILFSWLHRQNYVYFG